MFKFSLRIAGLAILFLFTSASSAQQDSIFIRINQVGFLPNSYKSATILSSHPINTDFTIINYSDSSIVFQSDADRIRDTLNEFTHNYRAVFSNLQSEGKYYLEIAEKKSFVFQISENIYNHVRDSLSLFFKVQRCGATDPILHNICHLSDGWIKTGEDSILYDVTGGWHDAGDYIKFFNTTALTTYLLLFAFDLQPEKFSFDLDGDAVPDILEEAKVGIDWLLRANYNDSMFVVQVQDTNDHLQKWRLPDEDSLQFSRPAILGISQAHIGIYSSVMYLASKIWRKQFDEITFSEKCYDAAELFYSIKDQTAETDTVSSSHYLFKNSDEKLLLAELERRKDRFDINDLTSSHSLDLNKYSSWWSWDDILFLPVYKLSIVDSEYINYLETDIESQQTSDTELFPSEKDAVWGFTSVILGKALKIILYKSITKDDKYDQTLSSIINYILGENRWGKSFIYNIGEESVKNLHSQIAFFKNGCHPGALSSGPSSRATLEEYGLLDLNSYYEKFNSEQFTYSDNRENFITNEPTIFSNATALLVFGFLSTKE